MHVVRQGADLFFFDLNNKNYIIFFGTGCYSNNWCIVRH